MTSGPLLHGGQSLQRQTLDNIRQLRPHCYLNSGVIMQGTILCSPSTVVHERESHTLSLSNMNVIDVGVRLQCEYQTNDVGKGQEDRHCVHQRPDDKNTHNK